MATPGRQLVDKRSRSDQRYAGEQEQNLYSLCEYLGKQMHSQEDDE
jgi:hypothetical protein